MINILISLDYEIFGRGGGDVRKHIIEPTDSLIDMCGKYGVPVTLMPDICEYNKFEEFDNKLQARLGYSPAELIREQLMDAVRRGHDVQLHIHPQWLDARYDSGKWKLGESATDIITDLEENRIREILSSGKDKLLSIVRKVNPSFKCNSVRFTGPVWREAPSEILHILEELGIKAHSMADYCPEGNRSGFWPLGAGNKLFEIPIHFANLPKYRIFSPQRLALFMYLRCMSPGNFLGGKDEQKKAAGYNFISDMFTGTYTQKWDLCKQSAKELVGFLDEGLERYDHKNKEVPLVMIGHSKDFLIKGQFGKFLKIVTEKYLPEGRVKFSTFQEFVKGI